MTSTINFDLKLRLIQLITTFAPATLADLLALHAAKRGVRLENTDELTYAAGLTTLTSLLAGDPTLAARITA